MRKLRMISMMKGRHLEVVGCVEMAAALLFSGELIPAIMI
jgi:hypothetical protein